MWPFKSKEERATIAAARQQAANELAAVRQQAANELAAAQQKAQALVTAFSTTTVEDAPALAQSIVNDPGLAVLPAAEKLKLQETAFLTYADNVLADDHLTVKQEVAFGDVATALGWPLNNLTGGPHQSIIARLLVGEINDGRLSTVFAPKLMAKSGEIVHIETPAQILKEVAIRQFQGGSQGVSFRVTKGVRYRVGNFKGQSVVVGRELQVQDVGTLSVSSARVVFLGAQKTMEFLYTKLVGIEPFDDGVRLQVSNRQNATLLKVSPGYGHVVAATINAAAQKAL